MYVHEGGWGGGGAEPVTLKCSPQTLTIEIKLCMMLDILVLLKSLSVEKKWKIHQFLLISAFPHEHLSKNL